MLRGGATSESGKRLKQMRTKTYDAAATETAAYDVLAMLMRLNGARPVLDILRYWYVISSLTGKRKTMPRP